MADQRITQLGEITTVTPDDYLVVVDNATAATKKVQAGNVLPDGSVGTVKLANGAVVPGKLSLGSSEAVTNTSDTSTSQTYISMVGAPSVTVTTGTAALVSIVSFLQNNAANSLTFASFAVSGATTQAATDNKSIRYQSYAANSNDTKGGAFLVLGLTPGVNTFTLQNRVGGNTGTYGYRYIAVVPL